MPTVIKNFLKYILKKKKSDQTIKGLKQIEGIAFITKVML